MNVADIKYGTEVAYKSKIHEGTAWVLEVYRPPKGGPGWFVALYDFKRHVAVTLRPTQVSPLKAKGKQP